jgi:segregation and condensation protein A
MLCAILFIMYNVFTIQTETYEGPFELVLELIENHKLHISELSLAKITDEFIGHIKNHELYPVEQTADFIGVASTLLLIKSKSLLPTLELTEGEQEDITQFQDRLQMYEKTREASKELAKLFGVSVLVSPLIREDIPLFSPSADLLTPNIITALEKVLTQIVEQEHIPEARVRSSVTLEQMMEALVERVRTAMNVSFKTFSADASAKVDVIVSFLALLELVKDGKLDAVQHNDFEDIQISASGVDVPHYGV